MVVTRPTTATMPDSHASEFRPLGSSAPAMLPMNGKSSSTSSELA